MEDNKIIVLAILILVISSFNVDSITGKATVSQNIGQNSQMLAGQTSIIWLLAEGKGDVDGDGIAFTDDDFKTFNLKYNKYTQLKSNHRGYYDPKVEDASVFYSADVFPAPAYYGETAGDGKWTERDRELFRQLVVKIRDKSNTDSRRHGVSSLVGECRDGQVSMAPRGYRRCNEFGEWEEYACPDGYNAILGDPTASDNQKVVCVKESLQAGEGLGILRIQ